MVSKKFFFVLFLFISLLYIPISCSYAPVGKYLKKQFNTFSPKEFYVDTNLIDINSLYNVKLIHYRNPKYKDTTAVLRTLDNGKLIKDTIFTGDLITNNGYVFYKNGFCVKYHMIIDEKHDTLKQLNNSYNICGIYKLCRDTLKIKTLGRSSLMESSTPSTEEWYQISSRTSLKLLYYKDLTWEDQSPSLIPYFDSVRLLTSKVYTIPRDRNLNSESHWQLNKRWFWKDKQEYKEWKKKNN